MHHILYAAVFALYRKINHIVGNFYNKIRTLIYGIKTPQKTAHLNQLFKMANKEYKNSDTFICRKKIVSIISVWLFLL